MTTDCTYWQQFSFCQVDEKRYIEQAHRKKNDCLTQLSTHCSIGSQQCLEKTPIYYSPSTYFRNRIEFAVNRFKSQLGYAMFDSISKQPIQITTCQQAATAINKAMPVLMATINQHPLLGEHCRYIHFRANHKGALLISLIYHQAIDQKPTAFFRKITDLHHTYDWNIIVRSRKQQYCCQQQYLPYTVKIDDISYTYWQDDNIFTQPNLTINQKMVEWIKQQISPYPKENADLLEIYCGNGNFSIALADQFQRVLSTEVVRESLHLANQAKVDNNIYNIEFVRLCAEETVKAINGNRLFNRLQHIDLEDYHFSTVLVDPPRSGIDHHTLQFLRQFKRIIYVSCNVDTLIHNINTLRFSHQIIKLALFDQFPYTHHLESIVILQQST